MAVSQVNFTSKLPPVVDPSTINLSVAKYHREKALGKEISNLMPKAIKSISKMSKFTGEIPNIIINALGTGLVAPIFIKYNFLSKTDDDTRTYSALRQPISAVLSVATSVAVVLPFNKLIDHMANNSQFLSTKYNKSAFRDVDFIKNDLKKANPALSAKQLDEMANAKYLENLEGLVKHAYHNNTIEYTASGEKVTLNQEEVKHILNQTTDDMLKNVNSVLDRHDTEKIAKQIQRGEYLRNNSEEVKETLAAVKKGVNSKTNEKEVSKYFNAKLKQLKAKGAHSELITIIEDISKRPDLSSIKGKITDVESARSKYSKYTSLEDVAKEVASKVDAENKALRAEKATLEEMKAVIKKGGSIKDVAHLAHKIPDSNFVYDVVQKHISNVGANLKAYKQVTGLVVSLAILPVACSMLNYIYPKFMDKFFPELASKKASKHKHDDTFVKSPAVKKEQEAC